LKCIQDLDWAAQTFGAEGPQRKSSSSLEEFRFQCCCAVEWINWDGSGPCLLHHDDVEIKGRLGI